MCIVCGPGATHLLRAIAARHRPRAPGTSRFAARVVAPVVVPPLDPTSVAELAGPADTILRGGPILTLCEAAPQAAAVAVRAGRIQAVGSEADVLEHRGRLTRIIDLAGRTLLPGFVNAHWHMPFTLLCDWVDARAADSPAAVMAALAQAMRDTPSGEWIVVATNADVAASTRDIGAAPGHPVLLTDPDGGIVAGNTLATAGGPLPAHVADLLPRFAERLAVSPEPIRRRLAALLRQSAATGLTCLRVCGVGTLAGTDDLDLMRAVIQRGAPPLRLRATLDAASMPEWDELHLAPGFGDDMFRVDTLSEWLGTEARGRLAATVRTARGAGWRVTAHATGRGELDEALHAFALCGMAPDPRHGIECLQMPEPVQMATIRRLGLSLGLTVRERLPAASAALPHPVGVPVSLGLDAATGPSAPLRMIAHGVDFGLDRSQSLAGVTIDAARRCGVGEVLGSIERGKYADFAFLDGDPITAADPVALRCTATWVNGREAFRA
jgi:predicted amidohydrolase YtcJ